MTMTPTAIDLEWLRALLERATPGPWMEHEDLLQTEDGGVGIAMRPDADECPRGDRCWRPNMDLVVAAVNALPALLALAERAQTDRAEVARLTDAWHQDHQEVEAQADEIARLRVALLEQHNWHLLQTDEDPSIMQSPADAYAESEMCQRALDALALRSAAQPATRADLAQVGSAAQPAAERWQPIETAPDDGRKVWVFGGRHEKPHLTEADGAWWRHAASTGSKAIATHWMEFEPPAPPAAAAERGEG